MMFDASVLRPGEKGVARYVHGLLSEIAQIAPRDISVMAFAPSWACMNYAHWSPVVQWEEIPNGSQHLWRLLGLPIQARSVAAKLVHVPIENPVGPLSVPLVLTVHENPAWRHRLVSPCDITFKERFSNYVTERLTPNTARRASQILAVSQTVAESIQMSWNLDASRVTVTHEAADERFFRATPDDAIVSEADDGYVLTFATGDPREDFETVFAAYSAVQPREVLCVAGKHSRSAALRSAADRHGILDRCRLIGYVPEKELHTLYASATIYVDMSVFEGFGLQVIEAMAAGAPLLVSDLPVLREVAVDSAIFVPPRDATALASAFRSLLSNMELRANLSARARTRARGFSWRRCAEQTISAYRQVLGTG